MGKLVRVYFANRCTSVVIYVHNILNNLLKKYLHFGVVHYSSTHFSASNKHTWRQHSWLSNKPIIALLVMNVLDCDVNYLFLILNNYLLVIYSQTTLPWVPPDTKLSKLDTLRLASSYIAHLKHILDHEDDMLTTGCIHPENLVSSERIFYIHTMQIWWLWRMITNIIKTIETYQIKDIAFSNYCYY